MASETIIEQVSAQVHENWMASKRAAGVESRTLESGEELMVPYDRLSEGAKDLDRGTVRTVLAVLSDLGYRIQPVSAPPREEGTREQQSDLGKTKKGQQQEPRLKVSESIAPTLNTLDTLVDYAYEHGFHEVGFPLVDEVREYIATLERNDASRVDSALAVDPSRSTPDALTPSVPPPDPAGAAGEEDKPFNRALQLERTLTQMRAESIERAQAYDDANSFHHQRIAALYEEIASLRARLAESEQQVKVLEEELFNIHNGDI